MKRFIENVFSKYFSYSLKCSIMIARFRRKLALPVRSQQSFEFSRRKEKKRETKFSHILCNGVLKV